jgi:hypothetical protein
MADLGESVNSGTPRERAVLIVGRSRPSVVLRGGKRSRGFDSEPFLLGFILTKIRSYSANYERDGEQRLKSDFA